MPDDGQPILYPVPYGYPLSQSPLERHQQDKRKDLDREQKEERQDLKQHQKQEREDGGG